MTALSTKKSSTIDMMTNISPAVRFTLMALAFALPGCTVGPDYQRPADHAPDHFLARDGLQHRQGKPPAAALDTWWHGFNDPQLTRLLVEHLFATLSST